MVVTGAKELICGMSWNRIERLAKVDEREKRFPLPEDKEETKNRRWLNAGIARIDSSAEMWSGCILTWRFHCPCKKRSIGLHVGPVCLQFDHSYRILFRGVAFGIIGSYFSASLCKRTLFGRWSIRTWIIVLPSTFFFLKNGNLFILRRTYDIINMWPMLELN